MNSVQDDNALTVTVYDYDSTFDPTTVPATYTMIFIPTVDEATLNALNTGRSITYIPQVVYTTQPLGDTGFVSVPSTNMIQEMPPVPSSD
jgi:hypothetical protein